MWFSELFSKCSYRVNENGLLRWERWHVHVCRLLIFHYTSIWQKLHTTTRKTLLNITQKMRIYDRKNFHLYIELLPLITSSILLKYTFNLKLFHILFVAVSAYLFQDVNVDFPGFSYFCSLLFFSIFHLVVFTRFLLIKL